MGVSDDANKTLFVGNLDAKVTEELIFELFLQHGEEMPLKSYSVYQAGPLLAVKIPRDKDGKAKQFAFVNFKHEESVHYGKDLLNGIQLYGKAINIQFRSGSSHGSREGSQYQNSAASLGPYQPNQFNNNRSLNLCNRLDRATDNMGLPLIASPQLIQRSISKSDDLHMQVVINNTWQKHARGGSQNYNPLLQHSNSNNRSTLQQPNQALPSSQNFVFSVQPQSSSRNSHVWLSEKPSVTQRQQAYNSYNSNNGNFTQDARFQDHNPDWHHRGNHDSEYRQDQTSYYSRSWEHDYKVRREYPRGGRR